MRSDTSRTWNLTMTPPDGGPATQLRGLSERDAVKALNDLMYGAPVTMPITARRRDKVLVAA
jgi:hypothetical protein